MRLPSVSRAVSILVGVLAVVPMAPAQSYGPEDQVLTIGGAEFRSESSQYEDFYSYLDPQGYLYPFEEFLVFSASLRLPEGASIEKVCVYADYNMYDDGEVVELVATKLVPGGEAPFLSEVPGSAIPLVIGGGYAHQCTNPFTFTLRSRIDVDGDGNLDAVAYYVRATIFTSGLGAVRITWKRQVSPQPSAPTFGDVPASDSASSYIEALAASGITAGCAGGNFCPDANLTRRQMAVFLAKALGLHWAD